MTSAPDAVQNFCSRRAQFLGGQGDLFRSRLARSTLSLWFRMASSCAANLKPSLIRPSRRNEETTVAASCSRSSRTPLRIYVLRSSLLSPNRHASMLAVVVCISGRKGTGLTQTLYSCIGNGGRGSINGEIGEGADASKSKIRGHNSDWQ